MKINQPLWRKYLASQLKNLDVVLKLKFLNDKLIVYYRTSKKEIYPLVPEAIKGSAKNIVLTAKNSDLSFIPKLYSTAESDLLSGTESIHCKVLKKDLVDISYLARRVLIHQFAFFMLKNGQDFKHNNTILEKDYKNFFEYDLARVRKNSIIKTKKLYVAPGLKIIEHYFPNHKRRLINWIRIIDKQLTALLKSNRPSLTTNRILGIYQAKEWSPLGFAAVLERCPYDSVLDLSPATGLKALACAKLGKKYIALPNEKMKHAIENGFAEYIGLDFEFYDENSNYELIIHDNGFKGFDLTAPLEYLKDKKALLVYVDAPNLKKAMSLKPVALQQFKKLFNINYFALYGS